MNIVKSEVMMQHIATYIGDKYKNKYAKIKEYALKKKVPSVSPLTGELLNLLIKIKAPSRVLELGCGIGMSTSYLLDSNLKYLDSVDMNQERLEQAKIFTGGDLRVAFYQSSAEQYLKNCTEKYDFIFVDTIKKDYLNIWYLLKPLLKKGALVVFDDVFMYGYVANQDCEIPMKYRNGVNELRNFIYEIENDKILTFNLLPIADGILVINHN